MPSKRCPRCDQTKPFDDFGSNRGQPFGKADWCLKCTNAYYQARRDASPELRAKLAAMQREYRKKPGYRAKTRVTEAAYNARNRELRQSYKHAPAAKARRAAHNRTPEALERRRINEAKRRALKKQAAAAFTLEDWQQLLQDFNFCCAYCLQPSDEKLQIEHLQPLALGGLHVKENIVPACRHCNQTKNSRDLVQFLAYSSGVSI